MKKGLLAILLIHTCSFGNDAAINDGSAGPEPVGWRSGEESIIQMKSEHLDIHFGLDTSKVHATFTFLSHKKTGPAVQKLGFPDYSRSEMDGDVMGPITKLTTKVDGKVVESKLSEGYFYKVEKEDGSFHYDKRDKPKPGEESDVRRFAWHIIEVTFPVGKEVVVERIYETPSGITASSESFMIYETRTGGAWRGDIEKLTAQVTLDEAIDPDLILTEPREGWAKSPDGKTLSLEWKNFEPRTDEDRNYLEVITLDKRGFENLHRDYPEEYPSLRKWIANWKKMYE